MCPSPTPFDATHPQHALLLKSRSSTKIRSRQFQRYLVSSCWLSEMASLSSRGTREGYGKVCFNWGALPPPATSPHLLSESGSSSRDSNSTSATHQDADDFGVEKGFWVVRHGAQELLRFANIYQQYRDNIPAGDLSTSHPIPKEINMVSMTQLSRGILHAVNNITTHSQRITNQDPWQQSGSRSSSPRRLGRPKRKRKREEKERCKKCGTFDSPRWRHGPAGPGTLCNVCGLLYAKKIQREGSQHFQ
ncbi:hypothetical protein B0H63DRAFT_31207 [Podospora didyma]|uniref:GATA-type domain-containing protein n=1 Tax=Podospora didyma TaxID=330526 RepID=A0AAE0U7K1_9PEZI|nr:hypothetical protein B0H63DRAFT_31207 [Podospora didyma]